MPVKIKLSRKVDVAPGIVNYELAVSKDKSPARKPKIDAAFAQTFSQRVTREAARIASFSSKQP
jgi:hypothetical protein